MIDNEELLILKNLEAMVRVARHSKGTAIGGLADAEISKCLEKIDALYSLPFDVRAAARELAQWVMANG